MLFISTDTLSSKIMANNTSHVEPNKSSISRWFANKSLKLSLNNRRRTKSKGSSSSLSSSSSSALNSPINSPMISSPSSETVRSKEDELRQVFRRFDANDDGKISALELRSYFGSIGEYMSHDHAKAVIGDFDTDGDESLDFQEFLKLMEREKDDDRDVNKSGDLKSAFEMFELENGCITPRSVQRMLGRLGDTRSFLECKAMVRAFDKDGNGVLDFDEFHQMMTAN